MRVYLQTMLTKARGRKGRRGARILFPNLDQLERRCEGWSLRGSSAKILGVSRGGGDGYSITQRKVCCPRLLTCCARVLQTLLELQRENTCNLFDDN